MNNLKLIFNFIGVSVVDWPSAFKFFSETLGIQSKLEPKFGDWAVLGGDWDAYYKEGNRSAIFELFDSGRPVTERTWGLNQGFRPGFHVSSLKNILGKYDVPFTLAERPWGKTAEFSTTEGIRFTFAEIPHTPSSDDASIPYIGHVAIKCVNFDAMKNFYGDILGFTNVEAGADYSVFAQADGHPLIILECGGSLSTFDPRNTPWEDDPVRAFPVFISLMTSDIRSASTLLGSQHVTILRGILSHDDWGGTDVHIADPDGNGIQVVQYE